MTPRYYHAESCPPPELRLLTTAQTLALASAFLFGLAPVLAQIALRHAPPLDGTLISMLTSNTLFVCLALVLFDGSRFDPRGLIIFIGVGLLFPAAVTLLTFEANRRMGPSVAGALTNLAPLFAVLPATLLLGETLRPLQMLSVALIIAGAVTLTLDRRWLGTRWQIPALALPVLVAAIRGAAQPITKLGLAFWPSPFAATLVSYLVSLCVIAIAVATRGGRPLAMQRAARLWFAVTGLCNGLAVLALYAALSRGDVIVVSPLVASYPIVTLVLSAALIRTSRLTLSVVAGVALTVTGVVFMLLA
jgi:drug/metabolite transporter (DMT)-like permease